MGRQGGTGVLLFPLGTMVPGGQPEQSANRSGQQRTPRGPNVLPDSLLLKPKLQPGTERRSPTRRLDLLKTETAAKERSAGLRPGVRMRLLKLKPQPRILPGARGCAGSRGGRGVQLPGLAQPHQSPRTNLKQHDHYGAPVSDPAMSIPSLCGAPVSDPAMSIPSL